MEPLIFYIVCRSLFQQELLSFEEGFEFSLYYDDLVFFDQHRNRFVFFLNILIMLHILETNLESSLSQENVSVIRQYLMHRNFLHSLIVRLKSMDDLKIVEGVTTNNGSVVKQMHESHRQGYQCVMSGILILYVQSYL